MAVTHSAYPTSYGNARVGTLECKWSDGGKPNVDEVVLIVTIAPDATRDGFESFVNGEQGSGVTSPSSVGPDAYFTGPNGKPDGFMFLTDHYGASAFSFGASGGFVPPATAVTATVWRRPTRSQGPCGIPSPRVVKSDDGEYSTSLFNVDRQVGGYSCDWVTDSSSTASAQVAVLPGGAGYAPRVRTTGSRDLPGIGDSAFVGPDDRLNVIAANGWVQVSATGATDDQLVALARVVLENNGYAQG